MSPRYSVLAGRIRQGLSDVSKTVERTLRHEDAARRNLEEDAFIDSLALNLHNFYSGLERIFLRIAADLDDSLPTGEAWHRELLEQMATEVRALRPAVMSAHEVLALDEYLRFRHVVRNIYAFELDRTRVEDLVQRLPYTFQRVSEQLRAFAEFLDQLTASLD